MKNSEKLEYIIQLEKKRKIKLIIFAVVGAVIAGAILVFAQYDSFESLQK